MMLFGQDGQEALPQEFVGRVSIILNPGIEIGETAVYINGIDEIIGSPQEILQIVPRFLFLLCESSFPFQRFNPPPIKV